MAGNYNGPYWNSGILFGETFLWCILRIVEIKLAPIIENIPAICREKMVRNQSEGPL
jgi:hypothetical protein